MPKKLNPFYEKMLKAKEAKKAMTKKDKQKKQEEFKAPPKIKGNRLANVPEKKLSKRIEVTAETVDRTPNVDKTAAKALQQAIDSIREQSQSL